MYVCITATLLGTLLNSLVTQISSQPITFQQVDAFSHADMLKFKLTMRMARKGHLSNFEWGMVVGAQKAG